MKNSKQMLMLNIASDLHLFEYNRYIEDSLISQPDNILVLAGDITLLSIEHKRFVRNENYSSGWIGLIKWLTDNFYYTCLIPGNHEFFTKNFEEGIRKIDKLNRINPAKFRILYNDYIYLKDEIWLVGTTLWSNIPFRAFHLNMDVDRIPDWTAEKHNKEYRCAVSYLNNIFKNHSDKKWIVVTHHAPDTCNTSNFFYSIEETNVGYSSDITNLVKKSCLWIFGHTHWNICQKIENSYIVSNCQGKKHEQTNNPYLKNYTISLENLS